jgi:hypothetical protein
MWYDIHILEYGDPNIVVEWLTLLLHIREVPGSNLDLETGHSDWSFLWFSSIPQGKFRDSISKLGHNCFLPHPFQFIIHLPSFHLMLYSLSFWKVSLNKIKKENNTVNHFHASNSNGHTLSKQTSLTFPQTLILGGDMQKIPNFLSLFWE